MEVEGNERKGVISSPFILSPYGRLKTKKKDSMIQEMDVGESNVIASEESKSSISTSSVEGE